MHIGGGSLNGLTWQQWACIVFAGTQGCHRLEQNAKYLLARQAMSINIYTKVQ